MPPVESNLLTRVPAANSRIQPKLHIHNDPKTRKPLSASHGDHARSVVRILRLFIEEANISKTMRAQAAVLSGLQ